MAQTTAKQKEGIEFVLEMSQEKYDVLELLAKLHGKNIFEYIHQNLIDALTGDADNIEDYEERKRARQAFENEESQVDIAKTIILHGEYKSNPEQLAAVASIAKAMEFGSPSELLQWAAISVAEGDLDHMKHFFPAVRAMEEALEA